MYTQGLPEAGAFLGPSASSSSFTWMVWHRQRARKNSSSRSCENKHKTLMPVAVGSRQKESKRRQDAAFQASGGGANWLPHVRALRPCAARHCERPEGRGDGARSQERARQGQVSGQLRCVAEPGLPGDSRVPRQGPGCCPGRGHERLGSPPTRQVEGVPAGARGCNACRLLTVAHTSPLATT